MKLLALFISALAALTAAQSAPNPITAPTGGTIQAGTATTITWTPTTQGTVTLELRAGSSNDLSTGITIASSIPNSGSFSWTPSPDIAAGSDYTIEIVDDSDTTQTNFSPMFSIASSGSSALTGSSSASASSTGTSSPSLPNLSQSSSTTSAAASSTPASTTTTTPLYFNSTSSSTTTTSTVTHVSKTSTLSQTNPAGSSPSPTSSSGANTATRFGYGMLTVAIGVGAMFAFV